MQKIALEISDILDTRREKSIRVMVKATGKPAWVPRSQAEFFIGKVVLPLDIGLKILGRTLKDKKKNEVSNN